MRKIVAVLMCCGILVSCLPREVPAKASPAGAVAILQAGDYPLWFQLGQQGPEQLNTIDEAYNSRALIPWPLAIHVRFILARNNDVYMAVNGDGFLVFSPWDESSGQQGTGMYRFSGGALWQPYTVAAFVFFNDMPMALLYRDDRFLDTDAALPSSRVWSFGLNTSVPFTLDIPALRDFKESEGWDVDSLRYSSDGFWYYRVVRKDNADNKIKYLRTRNFEQDGEETSSGVFYNSVMPEPLSAAPLALAFLLNALNSPETGTVMAVSPDFFTQRYFAHNTDSMVNTFAYYQSSPLAALAIDLRGAGLFAAAATPMPDAPDMIIQDFIPLELPPLPENFVYTGIALSGQNIIASWEEQEEYNTGAAGFMVLKIPNM